MRKYIKGAGAILILTVLVFSTTAVYGQNTKSTTENASSLAEISQPSTYVTNNEPYQSRGPVLWDNGVPDAADGLSCVYWPSYPLDRYIIDDFYVPEGGWEIGDGHFRIVTYSGGGPELIDNVLVYFFYNTGPCEPAYDEYVVADPSFTAELTGDVYFGRPEILVNCVFDPPVSLPMDGEWWVCFQPEMDDNSFWLTAATNYCSVYSDMADLGYYRWTWGYDQFGVEHDVSFTLTGVGGEPSVDVEKYVWDEKNGEWVDADTENMALDVPICTDVTFKIVVHNDGEEPLHNIIIKDKMHDSLKYISSDPEGEVYYEEPFWYIEWIFPGPIYPCDIIEVYITAHVEGPDCSYDYNHVIVTANGVRDEDYCYVHAYKESREFNTPILNFLENHPNMFPLLQLILQRLGLY